MKEQSQNIRDKHLYKFASSKKYLKIHVPDFAFKHDDNNVGKYKFVGRELQIRRLFTWLTSDSKSGSYLITGYRGMGKSLLVKRVIDMITREPKAYKEFMFQVAIVLTLVACFIGVVVGKSIFDKSIVILGSVALFIVALLEISKRINQILFEYNVRKVPFHHIFDKNMIAKFWLKNKDRRNRKYSNIAITVNLGQEVLNERDVLSLIAHSIREKYYKFVHNRQNRPLTSYLCIVVSGLLSFVAVKSFIIPLLRHLGNNIYFYFCPEKSWISSLIVSVVCFFEEVSSFKYDPEKYWIYIGFLFIVYLFFYYWFIKLLKAVRKKIPYFSTPYISLERLDTLCERVASSLNEEQGTHPQYSSSFFNFSFGKAGKSKSTPIATVRELEQELMGIVNNINGEDCPYGYCVQFIIVFDELDKIANVRKKSDLEIAENDEETSPAFETSVRGFTDAIAYEERKQKVLRLLANMKLFITSVKAKCVFISGHELFDASLADLSDREFAISSIFNGVLNVSSFLSPEREESDVSSMTEVYLATMLLPESYLKHRFERDIPKSTLLQIIDDVTKKFNERITRIIFFWPRIWPKSYLKQKVGENILKSGILKDELPSLRWYNEYLMDIHILNNETTLNDEELKERELEIRHVIEFLRCFCVYLSQISNGSPKKIATYFEKYVKVNFDTVKQFDWYDEIEVGQPTEDDVRKQCVLYFDSEAQRLINFIHYIAAPVMNAITNEVSHYGDKLLVSSSFILDQIYKYHGKGFSWRNLEQMPELLNTNKNPELRDSLASIMEFLLQTHITTISSSIFQYKFHKQIAEEISMLSKTSEEAAAIFNFTLNESEAVKRYNTRLLWNYMSLTSQTKDKSQKERYCGVLERLHENQGDIYFSEEDYYRAIHEYRSALQYINDKNISAKNLIPYLKCSLKIGMSYEYRHTFENAYMVYCQIINKLIHLRWVEEKTLGLDYTMRLTQDWRVKQAVLVDADSMKGWFSNECNSDIRRHFKPGLMEDLIESSSFKPEYSIDSDKTISHLTKNFTPEKSDILLQLTAFEDVKFIYQAILAKLFVIEKMESSGITQSSIDAAEAEFITLYSTVNYREKYILASDFFSKLSSILYYKNGVVSAEKDENIYTTLLLFDIDILALLDDYCYYVNKSPNSSNAIEIKNDIISFFTTIKTSEINMEWGSEYKNLSSFNSALLDKNKIKLDGVSCDNAQRYLEYFDKKNQLDIQRKWEDIKECFERRYVLAKYGCKLPCTACKYANRSIVILMKQLFGYDSNSGLKVIQMLRYSSHQRLFESRPEILSQLAASSEQLADIMLSCACSGNGQTGDVENSKEDRVVFNDGILPETIKLLIDLISQTSTDKREDVLTDYQNNYSNKISRLDLTILWYWSACRYYDLASMHHEAVHCIWRVTRVIENYLTVLSEMKNEIPDFVVNEVENSIDELLNHLFIQASIIVGRQYDNYNTVEIHELKWLLHFEHVDDIDMSQLTQFPDLQSVFLSIINCELLVNDLKVRSAKGNKNGNKQHIEDLKKGGNEYIKKIYLWLTSNRHNRTFKSNVELNYFKAKMNSYIFNNILELSNVEQMFQSGDSMKKMYSDFPKSLEQFLDKKLTFFEKNVFGISENAQSRLNLIDFLMEDSITCLFSIINDFPPHNQSSTLSNGFLANVYMDLWKWSKYYELMYNAYSYYRHYLANNTVGATKMGKFLCERDLSPFSKLSEKMKNANVICKDNFGYRYSKLFKNLRHDVDDATIHRIYINYSAEMAIKYYRAARGINSEGQEYKNLINTMYILDDDLRNDTVQSNLADERYLLNSGVINKCRSKMQKIYKNSRTNKIESYVDYRETMAEKNYAQLYERYYDSPYTNTEY